LEMDPDNPAADMSGLGIPGNVIADFEAFPHIIPLRANGANPVQHSVIKAYDPASLRRLPPPPPAYCFSDAIPVNKVLPSLRRTYTDPGLNFPTYL
jgi:hypothetical protein